MILDGKLAAKQILNKVKESINKSLQENPSINKPSIAILLVGNNKASETYVMAKIKTCQQNNIIAEVFRYQDTITTSELQQEIKKFNKSKFDGFIVQLPLPDHINKDVIINEISAYKDIDGFHPINFGKMALGIKSMRPATAYGIVKLIEYYQIETIGKNITIIGKSNIVGKPTAIMLSNDFNIGKATVTTCDINTPKDNLKQHCLNADIIIVAVGKPNLLTADIINDNCIIIDVGINKLDSGKIVGDCDFDSISKKAKMITPVPGGVGPMTICGLILNTYEAWKIKNFIE